MSPKFTFKSTFLLGIILAPLTAVHVYACVYNVSHMQKLRTVSLFTTLAGVGEPRSDLFLRHEKERGKQKGKN